MMTFDIDLRNAAIHMYLRHDFSLRAVARMLGSKFGKSTLHNWVRRHPISSAADRQRTRWSKVSREMKAHIKAIVESNPFLTGDAIATELKTAFGATLCKSTVCRQRRALGFTRKRTYAREMNSARVKQQRRDFAASMSRDTWDRCVSFDETCVYLRMPPRCGYAVKGRRLHVTCKRSSGDKFTLMLAIGREGILRWELIQGNGNAENFTEFIRDLPPACRGRPMLLDNVNFHHSRAPVEMAQSRQIQLVYTPTYSPDFNPVEMAFSSLKARMRGTPDQESTPVIDRTSVAMSDLLRGETAARMFDHAWAIVASCLEGPARGPDPLAGA